MKREARYVEANDPLAAQAHLIQAQDTQLRTRIAVALREHRERMTKDWERRRKLACERAPSEKAKFSSLADAIRLKQGRMGHKHLRTR